MIWPTANKLETQQNNKQKIHSNAIFAPGRKKQKDAGFFFFGFAS
jgi:hypothetical protein